MEQNAKNKQQIEQNFHPNKYSEEIQKPKQQIRKEEYFPLNNYLEENFLLFGFVVLMFSEIKQYIIFPFAKR